MDVCAPRTVCPTQPLLLYVACVLQDRGRDVTGVLEQYQRFVKPAFDNFVAPSRR